MEYLQRKLGFRILFVVDAVLLVLTQVAQGAALNYFFIKQFEEYSTTYFLFALDLICMIVFVAAMITAYRYFTHRPNKDATSAKRPLGTVGKHLPKFNFGDLPLCYISWIVYAAALITKLSFMNDGIDVFQAKPQIFQVCVACSCFVFVFLVEGHNWHKKSSDSYSFVNDMGRKTGIEIFDSVEMFIMLITRDHISRMMEHVLFTLATVNFILPTFGLYELSVTKFGENISSTSFKLKILHTVLRLVLIDIPFFVVRYHVWITWNDVSMFMMKNLLYIIFTSRELFVELYLHFTNKKPLKKSTKAEEIPLNQANEQTQTDGKTNPNA